MFGLFKPLKAKEISAKEAHDRASRGEIRLVDVREATEWVQAHAKGALHAPLSALAERLPRLPTDKSIVFYCLSGARSAKAVAISRKLGLPHDTHVAGGIKAWIAAGLPVTR